MFDQFLLYINEKKIVKSGQKVLLSVSGGMDSMVMVDLFRRAEIAFGIAHFNHHLRGKESDEEANWLTQFSKRLLIPFYPFDLDGQSLKVGNMQNNARKERYRLLQKTAIEYGFDLIATAHHFDDTKETFLINWMRGTGLDGLSGIPTQRDQVIRPLLFASRAMIKEYATEYKLKYFEDSSNEHDDYLRNQLRHHVLPKIDEIDLRKSKGIFQSIKKLHDQKQLLDFLFEKYIETIRSIKDGSIFLDISTIKAEPLSVIILTHFLKDYGFNESVAENILRNSSKTGTLFYSHSHQLLINRDNLIIQNKTTDDDSMVNIVLPCTQKLGSKVYHFEIVHANNITFLSDSLYINADHLQQPLIARKWQAGDIFAPFGLGGRHQKVKDYLTNAKKSRFEKANTYVMTHDEEIVAIIGERSSEKYKIDQSCQKALKITAYDQRHLLPTKP